MGAASVTGTGPGDAGITRGPGNGRNQFYSMVDPHVVWHGTVNLALGTATVVLPSNIRVPPTHLAVFTAGKGFAIAKNLDENDNMEGFTVIGYGTSIDYIVVDANNDCFGENYGMSEGP
jgi:hypothetical protein